MRDTLEGTLSAKRTAHDAYIKNTAPDTPYSASNFPDGSYIGTPQQTADFFNVSQTPQKIFKQDFWAAHSKLMFQQRSDLSFTLAGSYARNHDNENGRGQCREEVCPES